MSHQKPSRLVERSSTMTLVTLACAVILMLAFPARALPPEAYAYRTHAGASFHFLGWSVCALGDLDGDGKTDYAIGSPGAASFAGTVMVRSGATGALLYTVQNGTEIGFFGMSIANAGDVDGDGYYDLLVGAPLGTGDPGRAFLYSGLDGQLLRTFSGVDGSDLYGWCVASAGDFDGDGAADVIVGGPYANNRAGIVRVFSGTTGQLLFSQQGAAESVTGMAAAGVGDLDGDGFDDIAIGRPGAGLVTIHKGPDGSLLDVIVGDSERFFGGALASAGDLNGDGVNELIVGSPATMPIPIDRKRGAVFVYDGASRSLIWSEADSGPSGMGYAVAPAGDHNGDGLPDIAVASPWFGYGGHRPGRVDVRDGLTGQLLVTHVGGNSLPFFGSSVADLGDLTDDGRSDLLVGAPSNGVTAQGAAYVLAGYTPQFGVAPPLFRSTGAIPLSCLCAADLNRDGYMDVIAANALFNTMAVYINNRDNTLKPPRYYGLGLRPVAIVTADFNLDGKPDVAALCADERRVRFFRGVGDGTLIPSGWVATGRKPTAMVVENFTGTGAPSLVVSNRKDNNVSVYRNAGGNLYTLSARFLPRLNYAVGARPVRLATGRFNDDNRIDLAVANALDQSITVLLNQGDGSLGERQDVALAGAPTALAAADMNQDGVRDLAVLIEGQDLVWLLPGLPGGGFGDPQSVATGPGPAAVLLADFDGDGLKELVVSTTGDQSVTVMRNGGALWFFDPWIMPAREGSTLLVSGDFDRDVDVDIVAGSSTGQGLTILRNLWFGGP